MEKTLRLLEMGFSENQVSWAIEKFGESFISFTPLYLKSKERKLLKFILDVRIFLEGHCNCSNNTYHNLCANIIIIVGITTVLHSTQNKLL